MTRSSFHAFPRTLAVMIAFAAALTPLRAEPVQIIFDTDMDSDCDDAGAVAILHACADAGEVRILATVVSSHHPWAAPCLDAFNTYFGRPDLPIGAPKKAGAFEQGSKFAHQITKEFPHDLPDAATAPDASTVYREALARAGDHSVVIVTVGDLTNLRYLLETEADSIAPLTGVDLVSRKVKHWVCMGSRYPADLDPKPWGNFKPDAASTVKAINGWPGLITFTGGGRFAEELSTGAGLGSLPKGNPVRRAYELYFGGVAKDRHSADQIATMIAIRGTGSPWKLVTGGFNFIYPDGRHEWRTEPANPRQEYISALADPGTRAEVKGEIEKLMLHDPHTKQAH